MTLEQIKAAVDRGEYVYWVDDLYQVIKDQIGRYLIRYRPSGSCFGLMSRDGTLNNSPEDYHILEDRQHVSITLSEEELNHLNRFLRNHLPKLHSDVRELERDVPNLGVTIDARKHVDTVSDVKRKVENQISALEN